MDAATAAGQLLTGLGLDSKGFKQLLDSQSLVDCTLACDGGKISAHKVVLSACSSYLAKILVEHPVEHPIIILPELNIEDVQTLVHYMYTGELLKTGQVHSSSLLKTAAILSVNSLNDFLNAASAADATYFQGLPPTCSTPSEPASPTTTTTSPTSTTNQNHNQNHSLSPNPNPNPNPNGTNLSLTNLTSAYASVANAQGGAAQLPGSAGKGSSEFQFKCPVCKNDFQTICSFEYHMQRVHKVTSFGCEICHKPFASLRYVLTDHMRRCHGTKAEQRLLLQQQREQGQEQQQQQQQC